MIQVVPEIQSNQPTMSTMVTGTEVTYKPIVFSAAENVTEKQGKSVLFSEKVFLY